jgi:hypothetical protein
VADRQCFENAGTLSAISAATNPVIPTGPETGLYRPFIGPALTGLPLARLREDQVFPAGTERECHPGHYFRDDFYDRIHVIPSRIDVGNLTERVEYAVEFFNAFLENVSMTGVEPHNVDGVTLSELGIPRTIYALLSVTATVTVDLGGPAVIDGSFVFSYDLGPDSVLAIVGQRIIPFSIPPDWTSPVTEELRFLTRIIEARDGTEQRIIMRARPRWRMRYRMMEGGPGVGLADSLLAGWGGRSYALPVWTRKSRLLAPVLPDEASVQCDTADRGFVRGGLCVVWQDALDCEAHEIDAVGAGGLSLVYPRGRDFSHGYCVPARLARLAGVTAQVGALTTGLVEADLEFEADGPEDLERVPLPVEHGGLGIFPWGHDYSRPASRSLARSMDVHDSGLGLPVVEDRRGYPVDEFAFEDIILDGHAEIDRFKGFLAAVDGQAKAFWVGINEDQLLLSRRLDMGSSLMHVGNVAYGLLESGLASRRTLFMRTVAGRMIFGVTSFLATGQGDIALFTDTAWPRSFEIGEVGQIGFLVRARLAQDDFALEHAVDCVARVSVRMRGTLG